MFSANVKIHNGTASYQIRNGTSVSLNLMSYYWNGSDMEDFINHGIISSSGLSDTIYTMRNKIGLGGELGGKVFIVAEDYSILKNSHNILEMNNGTSIFSAINVDTKSCNMKLEKLKVLLNKR